LALGIAVAPAAPATPDGHLVSAADLARALDSARGARESDLAAVDDVLVMPEVRAVAHQVGLSPGTLRAGARSLDDVALSWLATSLAREQGTTFASSPGPPPASARALLAILVIGALVFFLVLLPALRNSD